MIACCRNDVLTHFHLPVPSRALLTGFVAAVLAFIFLQLADEVGEGDTHGFDMMLMQAAQSLRAAHPWLTDVMRDLSGLGSTSVLALFTVSAVGYVALVSSPTAALLLAILVGLSRVGLGVHWATDVLGGWAFGCAWAIAWLLIARFWQARSPTAQEGRAHIDGGGAAHIPVQAGARIGVDHGHRGPRRGD